MSTSSEIKTRGFPLYLLGFSLLIPMLGVLNLASAAKVTRPGLWVTQSAWLSMGIVIATVIVLVPPRWLHRLAYPIYMAINVLLVLVLVAGLTIKGAQRWLDIGFFHLQPSELAKVSVLIATARYFAGYHVPSGYTLRMLLRPFNLSRVIAGWGLFVFAAMQQMAGTPLKDITIPFSAWAILCVLLVFMSIMCFLQLAREGLHHRQLIAPMDIVLIPFALL